jgi:hypothetical protein
MVLLHSWRSDSVEHLLPGAMMTGQETAHSPLSRVYSVYDLHSPHVPSVVGGGLRFVFVITFFSVVFLSSRLMSVFIA